MKDLNLLVEKFNGEDMMIFHRERSWFIAKQVGRCLGYGDNGYELCKTINRRWSEEFQDGHDMVVIEGEKLKRLKELAKQRGNSPRCDANNVAPNAKQLLLLSEQGLYLACMKSQKPVGIKLRRWLADVILPAIRTKQVDALIAAQRKPPTPEEVEISMMRAENRRKNRELRLLERKQTEVEAQAQHERDLELYHTEHTLLQEFDGNPYINPRALISAKIALNQKLTGDRLNILKPAGKWLSPTQMAFLWGTSANVVGHCITNAGIRGDERYCRQVTKKAAHGVSKLVETYEYNEEGQELIREAFDEYVANQLEKEQATS